MSRSLTNQQTFVFAVSPPPDPTSKSLLIHILRLYSTVLSTYSNFCLKLIIGIGGNEIRKIKIKTNNLTKEYTIKIKQTNKQTNKQASRVTIIYIFKRQKNTSFNDDSTTLICVHNYKYNRNRLHKKEF